MMTRFLSGEGMYFVVDPNRRMGGQEVVYPWRLVVITTKILQNQGTAQLYNSQIQHFISVEQKSSGCNFEQLGEPKSTKSRFYGTFSFLYLSYSLIDKD